MPLRATFSLKFFAHHKVFARLFLKRRCRPPTAVVALRRARNLYIGVFFLKAFSFAPDFAKEKANGDLIFLLSVDYTWILHGRGINTYAKHVCWRRRDRGRTLFAREES